jgi:hypothetical protein
MPKPASARRRRPRRRPRPRSPRARGGSAARRGAARPRSAGAATAGGCRRGAGARRPPRRAAPGRRCRPTARVAGGRIRPCSRQAQARPTSASPGSSARVAASLKAPVSGSGMWTAAAQPSRPRAPSARRGCRRPQARPQPDCRTPIEQRVVAAGEDGRRASAGGPSPAGQQAEHPPRGREPLAAELGEGSRRAREVVEARSTAEQAALPSGSDIGRRSAGTADSGNAMRGIVGCICRRQMPGYLRAVTDLGQRSASRSG